MTSPTLDELREKRVQLKKMLAMAYSLPEDAVARAEVIIRIETELLYLKLLMNT